MPISIHAFLMGIATFSTTYTVSRFISEVSVTPHIGTIFLIFVTSALAFYSKKKQSKFIATIYLFFTMMVSYLVNLYHTIAVVTHSLPWPYQVMNNEHKNHDLASSYQIAELCFILLIMIGMIAVYYYLKKLITIIQETTN